MSTFSSAIVSLIRDRPSNGKMLAQAIVDQALQGDSVAALVVVLAEALEPVAAELWEDEDEHGD